MHKAGELRQELTPAERKLWAYLRGNKLNGVKFRRQHANTLRLFRVGNDKAARVSNFGSLGITIERF